MVVRPLTQLARTLLWHRKLSIWHVLYVYKAFDLSKQRNTYFPLRNTHLISSVILERFCPLLPVSLCCPSLRCAELTDCIPGMETFVADELMCVTTPWTRLWTIFLLSTAFPNIFVLKLLVPFYLMSCLYFLMHFSTSGYCSILPT